MGQPSPRGDVLPLPSPDDKQETTSRRESKRWRKPVWAVVIALTVAFFLSLNSFELHTVWPKCMRKSPMREAPLPSTGKHGGIAWFPCPDDSRFDCATFEAPMNYLDPDPAKTVKIAIRRLPAPIPTERKGTVFINPGGPGGSGTQSVLILGPPISVILDGKFDVLSFDPRNVNLTTPGPNCFPSSQLAYHHHKAWDGIGLESEARASAFSTAKNLFGATDEEAERAADVAEMDIIKKLHGHVEAAHLACREHGDEEMIKSASTAFVARDMKRILEALGEDDDGLKYWGFSYGTILGATFSAMFPELADKMILDGVAKATTYTSDLWAWAYENVVDSDKVYDGFFEACVNAGPLRCPLAELVPPESAKSLMLSVEYLKNRIAALYAEIVNSPIPVALSAEGTGILTSTLLSDEIVRMIYQPIRWRDISYALKEALVGNPQALFEGGTLTGLQQLRENPDAHEHSWGYPQDVGAAQSGTRTVMCGDTDRSVLNTYTLKDFQQFIHQLQARAHWVGEQMLNWVEECKGWPFEPYESYRGPWTAQEGRRKTRYPVLFVGNTADPVTPLASAEYMANAFGGDSATLLVHDGFGHGSLAHPSMCTAKTIRAYMVNGTLPQFGTVCKANPAYLFPTEEGGPPLDEEESDPELANALAELARHHFGLKRPRRNARQ